MAQWWCFKISRYHSGRSPGNAGKSARALREGKSKLAIVETELADVESKIVTAKAELSRTEALVEALVEGIDMLGCAVLRWISASKPSEEKLTWGTNAPKAKDDRKRIATRIQPVMAKLAPIAQSISRAVEGILTKERADIAADTAYVLDLSENLEADQRAELTRILNANSETDPTFEDPSS